MSTLPLQYWCDACGSRLMRSSLESVGVFEAICRNRRCPSRVRLVRVPEDAADSPRVEPRFRHAPAPARSA